MFEKLWLNNKSIKRKSPFSVHIDGNVVTKNRSRFYVIGNVNIVCSIFGLKKVIF